MSEYQYYEFLALDQPLAEGEIEKLQQLSSRAEVTSTRFRNVYNYGDFQGDVLKLMTECFDAMVYVANWGTHQFMLRLPRDLADEALLKACFVGDSASLHARGRFLVLEFRSDTEDYEWEEGEGWLSSLAPLRAELLHGDHRAAYLAWLLCAQDDGLDEDLREPPVPPGLSTLSAALKSLVEYLRIDPDLLAAAADNSPAQSGPPGGFDRWLKKLPEAEKDRLLLEFVEGRDALLGTRLLRRFRSAAGDVAGGALPARRTIGELLQGRERNRIERAAAEERRAAEERARRAAEAAAAQARRLQLLAGRQEETWRRIEELALLKNAKAYDEAAGLLSDLKALSEQKNTVGQFRKRLDDFCERHARKRVFLDRLKRLNVIG